MESAASILAADDDKTDLTETRVQNDLVTDDRPARTYIVLFQLSTQEAADAFVRDLHGAPCTSLDETERYSVYHVVALQADNDGVGQPREIWKFFTQTTQILKTAPSQLLRPYH